MSLTSEIKNFALDLGYSKVGVTTADAFNEHIAEVETRGDMYDFYLRDPRKLLQSCAPRAQSPWARSIIVLVWDYMQKEFPAELSDKIGRIYQARCYGAPPERINGARFELMLAYLRSKGLHAVSGVLLPARWTGARSGATNFGRNNFAFAGGSGSFVVVNPIIVDVELEYDTPDLVNKCPPNCRKCIDACPTKALYEPFRLNPRKCIAFNTFRTTMQSGADTDDIPMDIRPLTGQWIHGCDACQTACPRNAAKMKAKLPKDNYLEELNRNFSLSKLLAMPAGFYETWVQPVMYNYIREPHIFQRNAAVAMGNSGDDRYISDLTAALQDPSTTVRGHAVWALGRLGGSPAKRALEKQTTLETAASVQTEVKLALELCR